MKDYIYFFTTALLSFSLAYSEEPTPTKQPESHHRFYVGPDVFWDHARINHRYRGDDIDVTFNTVFGGLRLGYDYLKPRAFYFGMDGLAAVGIKNFKNNSVYWLDYYPHQMDLEVQSISLFANIEQRYGYTFQSPISAKSTLIPLVGIGWYHIEDNYFSMNWLYCAAGLRATQEFCENFDLGFNLKAMYAFIVNFWGYEVAFPFTWRFEASKKWDLQFQPYLLKLDVDSIACIFGARLQAGYSF